MKSEKEIYNKFNELVDESLKLDVVTDEDLKNLRDIKAQVDILTWVLQK